MPLTSKNQLTIEKTPHYFIRSLVPELVHKFNPNIKLILVIRDPTTRAISHFTHDVTKNRIKFTVKKTFDNYFDQEALENFDEFKENSWIKHGIYIFYLKRWLNFFPLKQFLILDGENLIKDPFVEVKKMEKFLNLRPYLQREHFVYDDKKGFYCMNKNLDQNEIECLGKNKGRKHPNVSQSAMDKLNQYYRPFSIEFFNFLNQQPFWSI